MRPRSDAAIRVLLRVAAAVFFLAVTMALAVDCEQKSPAAPPERTTISR